MCLCITKKKNNIPHPHCWIVNIELCCLHRLICIELYDTVQQQQQQQPLAPSALKLEDFPKITPPQEQDSQTAVKQRLVWAEG